VYDFLFGCVSQPAGRFEPKRTICVASFGYGDLLYVQLLGTLEGVRDNHRRSF